MFFLSIYFDVAKLCAKHLNFFFSFSEAVSSGSDDFFSSVINCCLRLDTRTRVIWPFECTLINTPLVADFCEPVMCIDYESAKVCMIFSVPEILCLEKISSDIYICR